MGSQGGGVGAVGRGGGPHFVFELQREIADDPVEGGKEAREAVKRLRLVRLLVAALVAT